MAHQICSALTDTAEGIIWNAKNYNKTYRDQLIYEFKKLFSNGTINYPVSFIGLILVRKRY